MSNNASRPGAAGRSRHATIAEKRTRARQTATTLLQIELLEFQLAKRMPAAVEAEILAVELLERLRITP